MFWPLIYFFIHETSTSNVSARIRTQYFDSRFVYIWKVDHIQKSKLPIAITSIIYLSVPELENSVFLDLVLVRFTPVASYSFPCLSWRSSYTATLCTCFWIFLPSGIQSSEEIDGNFSLIWVYLFLITKPLCLSLSEGFFLSVSYFFSFPFFLICNL